MRSLGNGYEDGKSRCRDSGVDSDARIVEINDSLDIPLLCSDVHRVGFMLRCMYI